jgi:hypothetical protein
VTGEDGEQRMAIGWRPTDQDRTMVLAGAGTVPMQSCSSQRWNAEEKFELFAMAERREDGNDDDDAERVTVVVVVVVQLEHADTRAPNRKRLSASNGDSRWVLVG